MKVGLVGYAGSGKTTVFQWLTGVEPDPAKIQQGQMGMAAVPDERLSKMIAKFKPKKHKFAEIAFLDTPGLMTGEKKDNPRRLGILREADGLVIVLDGFTGASLLDQLQRFREELIFADLELVLNRIDKLKVQIKKNKPVKEREADEAELVLMQRIQEALEAGKTSKSLGLKDEEEKIIRSFQLFTLKPEIVFINQGDSGINEPLPGELRAAARKIVKAPVKLEVELKELDEESRQVFMADLGITGSFHDTVLREISQAMNRIVFFTVGEDECRAWAIDQGTPAVLAAGAIHTDLSRTFIRAEVVSYDDFLKSGYEEKNCKANGTFRLESKEYIVQDGDIMHIRANS
ncbi:DUF933 domain-containing protein [Telmatocola sphagniphila]|uniref:DUF933 domain-containing protein n=1 Tax=Telmatocola sphagniphila TaxID=1123043 RepID=A0A8E6EWV8_9BACT|nr:DUF933 domain-containing protein [Telmatocola sphagniphila]QVL30596.1 DUF933 domain-containing protein [Telmatocola sphagniphila]